MDKEDVVHMHNGVLFSHYKEWNAICSIMAEKTMALHSSILAWKIPWTEEPGKLQSMGSLRANTTERLHFHFSLSCIGEGNGNPFQCSCLENPRDGGAWWAAIYGVTQSRTQLKWLSSSSSSTSTMDGPRECHAEWSKSDREGEISHDIPYMWALKRSDTMNLQNRKRFTDLENELLVARGKG